MKKFLKNIVLFFLFTLIIGEVMVRLTHATADIPKRTIDEHGIQKYLPNQEGYSKEGTHKWVVNKLGWPGELPKNYDNLLMIIGDSYIENFMNPNECHQSVLLKEKMKNYNFMEAGRSGVSLIEAMEISKQMDSLHPIRSLIYINNEDIYESISQIKPMNDITQLDVKTNTINYGELKAPTLKNILYTWKLMYYFYNRFPLSNPFNKNTKVENNIVESNVVDLDYNTEIMQLAAFIKQNYSISDKTLVFHPNSDESIIKIFKTIGLNIIALDSRNDNDWTFDYDPHWTCYGHEKAAEQISKVLKIELNKSKN